MYDQSLKVCCVYFLKEKRKIVDTGWLGWMVPRNRWRANYLSCYLTGCRHRASQ
jgi:hypothetical protein